MTIWFLVGLPRLSPDNRESADNAGPPIMTLVQRDECRAVVMTSLRIRRARSRAGWLRVRAGICVAR